MKRKNLIPVNIIIGFLFILGGCKKEPEVTPIPIPGKDPTTTEQKANIRFVTNLDLSGQPYHTSNLKAVISIRNAKNEIVLNDSILFVDLNGRLTTQPIELPLGSYKLTSFRVEYGSVYTHFATPIAGSMKASLIQKPLSFDFVVEKGTVTDVPVTVLKVQNNDKPEDYGYPSGAFDYGQSNADPYLKVKLKAIMKIGNVLYDSIPASLKLTTWKSNGQSTTLYAALNAGVTEVSILKDAVKYEFNVSKWGISDAITLNRNEVDEVTVYTFGGAKEAKKLKSEIAYVEVNGNYISESKNNYSYDAKGNLSKIEYWLKKSDNTPYLSMTDRFEWTGPSVQKIFRYNEQNQQLIFNSTYTYDNQGKVINMVKMENGAQTTGNVQYFYYSTPEVNIHIDFPGNMDVDYYSDYRGGNTRVSTAKKPNGDTEFGTYDYDFNINPYIHMNWPDLFLSHQSKNNMLVQRMQYIHSYPINVPYSFNYTYDADGYPTSVITNYRSYLTGKHVFSTKKTFAY